MEKEMADVLRSGHFILGPKVADLEAQVAAYCQCKYAVGVSSGTDALLISLMAAGICPGDDVITTPYTFFATLGCITRLGARPLLVDIDPESYNIDPDDVAGKITERTRAIIPVHLYGQCADMDPILEVADKFQMTVIEDAAQAIGSEYKFKRAGSLGDYGCFSFFPTKNLGGFGDGGIVTTNSEESYERLKLLRVHGSKPKYCHKVVGGNFRLDALQAAVVSAKLKYLEGWTEKRRQHAENYGRLFEQHGLAKKIILPKEIFPRHIYNQYVIRVPQGRDKLMVFLKEKGIGVEIYYPVPMHLQECFAVFGCKKGDCPNSELAAEQTLALPISPELSPEQQEYVVESIKGFVVNHTELGEA
ncbi:MAG: DegT/DnrJ/EryC1/StrS family aminotransferase [Nitrospinota bacterium]|nr:DegT/DnrJ/EryC1/StrS family aminotransferase [Nitrospinota bacterium]